MDGNDRRTAAGIVRRWRTGDGPCSKCRASSNCQKTKTSVAVVALVQCWIVFRCMGPSLPWVQSHGDYAGRCVDAGCGGGKRERRMCLGGNRRLSRSQGRRRLPGVSLVWPNVVVVSALGFDREPRFSPFVPQTPVEALAYNWPSYLSMRTLCFGLRRCV
jgi:hypothetical protein